MYDSFFDPKPLLNANEILEEFRNSQIVVCVVLLF